MKNRFDLTPVILIALALFLFSALAVFAAGPGTISYQGRVKASDGSTPADGLYTMKFSLYNVELDGDATNVKWEETHSSTVQVKNGAFAVQLGSQTAFPAGLFTDNPNLWLQVQVDLDKSGFEEEEIYTPRMQIAAAGYAFQSDNASTADLLDGKDSTEFASSSHDHNSSYYLKSELDVFLSDKANSVHNHDSQYYTETEIDTKLAGKTDNGHNHDSLYYPQSQIDTQMSGKADSDHLHDLRYYPRTELDGELADKADVSHIHDARYYTQFQIDTSLSGKSDVGHDHDTKYYTQGQVDSQLAEKADSVHGHDTLYYRKSEVDTALSGKSDTGHDHNSQYYTESEIDTKLSNKSDTGHKHDDVYYTEPEVDNKLAGKADFSHDHDILYYTKTQLGTSGAATLHWDNLIQTPFISQLNSVNAGAGLTGGGNTGNVTLDVRFGPSGTTEIAARSDHNHELGNLSGSLPDSKVDDNLTISSSGSVSAAALTGTVSTDRYSAYSDLSEEGRINNSSSTDILLRSHGDARYAMKDDARSLYDAVVATSGGDYTSLKAALDGGARSIYIRNGTYVISADTAVIWDGVSITGESRDRVILDFNNVNRSLMVYVYPDFYKTGTVSVSPSSKVVTGSGTTWSSNAVAGQYIFLKSDWYKISSVDSNTQLTLEEIYRGRVLSGIGYEISHMIKGFSLKNVTITGKPSSGLTALQVDNVINANISNCLFRDNLGDYQLRLDNCYNSIVSGNVFENGVSGLEVEGSMYNMIRDNVSVKHSTYGFRLHGSSRNSLTGNIAKNNIDGFNIYMSGKNSLRGNVGNNNFANGLYLYTSSMENSITGNEFSDNYSGILMYQSVTRNIVLSNTCIDNAQYGVSIVDFQSRDNIVGMNNLYNNGSAAGNDNGINTMQKGTNYPVIP